MKKHDSPNSQPAGRGSADSRSDRSVSGIGPRSNLNVSRAGSPNGSPNGRRPGYARGRRRRNRTATILIVVAILLVAFLALGPLVSGLIQLSRGTGPSTGSSGAGTGSGTSGSAQLSPGAATSGSGTSSTASGTPSASGSGTSGSSSSGTTASASASSATPTTADAAARAAAFAAAKTEFEALVKGYKGRYALYYRNLTNGETYTYNADQPFVAASSIKLGINTYLYTQIEAGKVSATEMLAYDSRPYPTGDYEAGTGSIQGQPNGTKYSVRDTSGLSIRISDNCGTNMIIRRLGGIDTVNVYLSGISAVVDYRKSVSYRNWAGTTVSGRHRTSATDLGKHAVRLYELYKQNPAHYGTLIEDLKKTEFDFGIQKGIPTSVGVAHKIGTNGTYNTENDVGIVFAPEPFVLAVMTESGSAATAHQFQAKAATIFYNYIDKIT